MTAALLALFSKYGAILMAALAALGGVFYAGKKSGDAKAANARADDKIAVAESKAEAAKIASEEAVKTVKEANDVLEAINRMDAKSAADKLRNEWSRD